MVCDKIKAFHERSMDLAVMLLLLPLAAFAQQLTPDKNRCLLDRDCVANAYCKDRNFCQCVQGYRAEKDPSTTREMCVRGLGASCSSVNDCRASMGELAECRDKLCACDAQAHYVMGHCYHTSHIGQPCRFKNECQIENPDIIVGCENGICVCPRLYRPNENGTNCIPLLGLGLPCKSNLECNVTGSVCEDVCRCLIKYVRSADGDRCLPASDNLGQPCEENDQCAKFIDFSICKNNTCDCPDNFHNTSSKLKCWRNIGLSEMCENDAECIVANGDEKATICNNENRCQCAQNYVQNGPDLCLSHSTTFSISSFLVTTCLFLLL